MKVEELIKKLKEFDGDIPIMCYDYDGEHHLFFNFSKDFIERYTIGVDENRIPSNFIQINLTSCSLTREEIKKIKRRKSNDS